MRIDLLSLFPEYFESPFNTSMIKRAKKNKHVDIHLWNIRDFSKDKHKKTDDRPFGGGPGMVMMAQPIMDAIDHVKRENSVVIYLSPQGQSLKAELCEQLAEETHLILLCGHYEGIDERVMKEVDKEISIGDYVLTNGCIASIVLVDSVIRFLPGVLGHEEAARKDSFQNGIFDAPHYTRPIEHDGDKVPDILLSGHHEKIEKWRYEKGLAKTKQVRRDLYDEHLQNKKV